MGGIDSAIGVFMWGTGLLWPGASAGFRWADDNYLPWPMLVPTVENHPLIPQGTATTFGSVVCSSGTIDRATWQHEQQHYKQRQAATWLPFPFNESYIPAHLGAQAWSAMSTGTYNQGNPLETGPYSNPPRPWP